MAKGFLTMFEDPVVGPQLAMGALSLGAGLLTSRPRDVPNVIQGGLGQISQAMFYGGRQQQKESLAEQKRARMAEAAAKFAQLGQPQPSGTTATPAPGAQQVAEGGAQSAGMPSVNQLMQLYAEYPEMAPILGPAIAQGLKPQPKTKTQELLDLYKYAKGTAENRAGAYGLGFEMTPEEQKAFDATAQYRAQLDSDRDASRAVQVRGQNMSATNAGRTAGAIASGLGSIASGVGGQENLKYLGKVSEAIATKEATDFVSNVHPAAQAASVSLEEVAKAKDAIKSGAYQGPGADVRLKASQFVKAFTGPGAFDRASATEALGMSLDMMGLSQLKPLVGSQQISNTDIRYVMKAMGEIGTDPTALSKVLDRTEDISKRAIDKNNQVVDKFGKIQGGDQLGMEQYKVSPLPYASMTSPDAVKEAVKDGSISKETATDILRQKWPESFD